MHSAQYSVNSILYSFSIFLPTIIQSTNSEACNAAIVNLLTVPVHLTGATIYLLVARISDTTHVREPYCIAFNWIAIAGYAMLIPNLNPALSYIGCLLVAIGCHLPVGLPMSWLAANNPRCGKRTTATGIQLTLGSASGVGAPFLYSFQHPAGGNRLGYGSSVGLLVVSSLICITTHMYWRIRNRKKAAGKEDCMVEGLSPEEVADAGDGNSKYMFTI